jgi:hypothetical protein
MRIGIVGHEAAKFTPATESAARRIIQGLLQEPETIMVSGHCHLGGIDIWAEEEAATLRRGTVIFPPLTRRWSDGYMPRNVQIAETADVVHCLVVKTYPATYTDFRFDYCYHCHTRTHVKSGGCWTAKRAQGLGKPAFWHEL